MELVIGRDCKLIGTLVFLGLRLCSLKNFSSCLIFLTLLTAHNSSCGKVMFSQACVKNSVHGVCVSQHLMGRGVHPLGRHPLCRHSPRQTPLGRPPEQTPAWADTRLGSHPTRWPLECLLLECVIDDNLTTVTN